MSTHLYRGTIAFDEPRRAPEPREAPPEPGSRDNRKAAAHARWRARNIVLARAINAKCMQARRDKDRKAKESQQ
jgi:hypothetical protein